MNSKRKAQLSVSLISICGLLLYIKNATIKNVPFVKSENVLPNTNEDKPTAAVVSPLSTSISSSGAFVGGTTLPEIRTRVREEIENLIGNPATPNLDSAQFRKAFESFIHPTLAATLDRMNPEQESGKAISESCDPFESEALTIFTSLQEKGEVPFASGPVEQESLLGMFSILMIQAGAGGRAIPETLEGLASHLPPTRADFFVCVAAREALQVVNRTSGPLRSEELAAWQRLATAQNPVYRGLALLGAPRVCVDQEQLTTIYASFRHESDPELFRRAIERLSQFDNNSAQSQLQSIRKDAVNSAPSEALNIMDNALLHQAEAVKLKAAYGER